MDLSTGIHSESGQSAGNLIMEYLEVVTTQFLARWAFSQVLLRTFSQWQPVFTSAQSLFFICDFRLNRSSC